MKYHYMDGEICDWSGEVLKYPLCRDPERYITEPTSVICQGGTLTELVTCKKCLKKLEQ